MEENLIQQNIERIKTANLGQLLVGGIQLFFSRLPLIGAVLGLINLPVALYYGLYGGQMVLPYELTEAGELLINEAQMGQFYQQLLVDIGIEFYALIGLLAVAFIVELTIHGEIPEIEGVLGHAVKRWFAGIQTGIVKGLLLILVWFGASLIGALVYVLLSAILPAQVALVIMVLVLLALVAVPLLGIITLFYYGMYAASLRDVGGRKALLYSMGISRAQWMNVLQGLLMVAIVIQMPLNFFQIGVQLTSVGGSPLVDVVTILFFRVLAGLPYAIFTLFFLHLDYVNQSKAEEVPITEKETEE